MERALCLSRDLVRYRPLVSGLVQGVGFRPFVGGPSASLGLSGFVGNNKSGVFVELPGSAESVAQFTRDMVDRLPLPTWRVDNG